MRTSKTKIFSGRRIRFARQMGASSIAVIAAGQEKYRNRDSDYPFRSHSDFLYLCGFPEPEAVLVIVNGGGREKLRTVLFCRPRDALREIWDGRRAGPEGAKKHYGADEAYPIDEIDTQLPKLLSNKRRLFYAWGSDAVFDERVNGWRNRVALQARSGVAAPQEMISPDVILHEMRLFKDASEVQTMRRAAQISAGAHRRAMMTCRPGKFEYEIEAELLYEFTRQGSRSPAYSSIVGGGENGCILHYRENNAKLCSGDLLLIDAGAELDGYASDITRTFPVNGRFSKEQRALYNIVLAAQKAAIAAVKPGKPWNAPHDAAVRVLAKGLIALGLLKGDLADVIKNEKYKKFYMHRTGHWLGMDVHDVGEYKVDGKWRKLRPGMVLTVEPGLYIAAGTKGVAKKWWNIGIRIEDDVLVTRGGCDVLSRDAPKEPDEIEAIMQGAGG